MKMGEKTTPKKRRGGPTAKKESRAKDEIATRPRTFDLFERLRADILHCRLNPGARLIFRDLRQQYGAGLSPLREALMRLVSDRLVVLEVNKGFRVAPVSREEVLDVTNTWIELEAIAIRMAVQKGDDRWEGNILARLHELSKRAMSGVDGKLDPEWERRNTVFHESLYAACGSPTLMGFIHTTAERYSRYLRLWARHAEAGRDVAREHQEICKAVVGRNADKAVVLIRDHRTATTDSLLELWPEAFSGEITEEL